MIPTSHPTQEQSRPAGTAPARTQDGNALPRGNDAPGLQAQPRPPSYLMRHAQGRLPLWLSLWVNYIGLSLLLCLLSVGLKQWSFVAQAAHQPFLGLFLLLLAMSSFCALFLAIFWGAQGTLLAAYDYGRRTGRKALAGCLYAGVILYAIVWTWGLAKAML